MAELRPRGAKIGTLLCVLTVAVSGCHSSNSSGDSPASTEPSISSATSSISIQASVAQTIPPLVFYVPAANTPSTGLHGYSEFSGDAVTAVTWASHGGPSAPTADVTVQLAVPGDFPPGVVTGEVRFKVCTDQPCTQQVRGSPIVVPVTLTVTALPPVSVTSSPTSIDVTAMQGVGAAGPQVDVQLTFSSAVQGTPVVSVAHSGALVDQVTATVPSSTAADVALKLLPPDALPIGQLTETLTIDACYTASCVNHVAPPLAIPLTYTVEAQGPQPEPGIAPLAPTSRILMTHDVVDAEYSKALDAIVTVASYPDNALYVYDVNAGLERRVALTEAPTSVSVSPDGLHAAVGHGAAIAYFELADVGVVGAPPPKELGVSAPVLDVVLDGRGYVHAFPRGDGPVTVHSVAVATGTEATGHERLAGRERGRLHPSGDYVYVASDGPSPGDGRELDVRTVPTRTLRAYGADRGPCGNLWFSENGTSLYTACGRVFVSSPGHSIDMTYAGALELPSTTSAAVIRALSQSDAKHEIVVLEEDGVYCGTAAEAAQCYTHVGRYDSDLLGRKAVYSLAPITVQGRAYSQRGLFVFHSAAGDRKFLLSRAISAPNPADEYYLSEF